jgi:DNA-binding XRE family transcriptional regulator
MAGRQREPITTAGPHAELARRLRDLRDRSGLTLRQLAERSGYSRAALSAAEAGRHLPSWELVAAFAQSCRADAHLWRQLWEMARDSDAGRVATTPAPAVIAALPPDGPAQVTDTAKPEPLATLPVTAPPVTAPPVGEPAVVKRPPAPSEMVARRYSWLPVSRRLIGVGVAGVLAVVGLSVLRDMPTRHHPPGPRQAQIVTPVIAGHDCSPQGILAPSASASAQVVARPRMGFESDSPIWGPYWNEDNVHEQRVGDHPYEGRSALEVRVGPGLAAIGTTRVDGLLPEATLRLRLWYGGSGQGMVCPFVQDTHSNIQWIRVAPLSLAPAVYPGWQTFEWRMPDMPVHGVGIQVNDTGVTDLVIRIDDVEW